MRRTRCSVHPDILSEGACPECEITHLKKEIEKYKKALDVWGDPVIVNVTYRFRDVFSRILRALSVPGTNWNSPKVKLGNSTNDEGTYPLPRNVAEELANTAQVMEEEYQAAMVRGYNDGVSVIKHVLGDIFDDTFSRRIVEALKESVTAFNDKQRYSFVSAIESAVRTRLRDDQED
jgi:hypothetical protein